MIYDQQKSTRLGAFFVSIVYESLCYYLSASLD